MTKPGKFDSNGAWDGFCGEIWQEEINVRDFIQKNYIRCGDELFLVADETHDRFVEWCRLQAGAWANCGVKGCSGLTALV
ncbi:MAG: hypothetical protein ACLU3N_07980 [Lachnospiraceae bacterium]